MVIFRRKNDFKLKEKPKSYYWDTESISKLTEQSKKLSDHVRNIILRALDMKIYKVYNDPLLNKSVESSDTPLHFVKVSRIVYLPDKTTEFLVHIVISFKGVDGNIWRIENKILVTAYVNNELFDDKIIDLAITASNCLLRQYSICNLLHGDYGYSNFNYYTPEVELLNVSDKRSITGYIKSFGTPTSSLYSFDDILNNRSMTNDANVIFESIGVGELQTVIDNNYMEFDEFVNKNI